MSSHESSVPQPYLESAGAPDSDFVGDLAVEPDASLIDQTADTSGASNAAGPAALRTDPDAAAIAALGDLGERPLAEHPAVYERIHAGLQSALADIDDA